MKKQKIDYALRIHALNKQIDELKLEIQEKDIRYKFKVADLRQHIGWLLETLLLKNEVTLAVRRKP